MSRLFFPLALLLFSPLIGSEWDSFTYFPAMDVPYHPVSTMNPQAQEAFDKGLIAIYAFNYDQAVQYFDQASQLDPNLAMAYWGMALAVDQSLDPFVTPNRAQLTYDLCTKALKLSKDATAREQAYISALSKRFSSDFKVNKNQLRIDYKNAMAQLAHDYPDDADALTLYAESIFDTLLWRLWIAEEKPREGTLEIISILETVLKSDPMHLGANHYYIHALEHSPYPERGLMAAARLDSAQLQEWAHLIHSASHIYMRVGSYEKAIDANLRAIDADEKYVGKHGWEGRYPLKYYAHNLYYLTFAYMWQERFEDALERAQQLHQLIKPHVDKVPSLDYNLLMPYQVYLYFHRWEDILKLPDTLDEKGMVQAFKTFTIAMAYAGLGNLEKAKTTHSLYVQQRKAVLSSPNSFAQELFEVCDHLIFAALAKLEGKFDLSIAHLKQASQFQEVKMGNFIWGHQICQTLGAQLIEMARFAEAEQAFRKSLIMLPRNGRSLFGLLQALKLQNKSTYSVERECKAALKNATHSLVLSDL